jgi:hypothetical protein
MYDNGMYINSFQLSWLLDHYVRGVNCILADEMGLGEHCVYSWQSDSL